MFDASRDPSCQLEVYYRLQDAQDDNIRDNNWTYAEFNLDANGSVTPSAPEPNDSRLEFSSYEVNLIEQPAFVACQIKIVMRGGNPAKSPLIKNFRMIALDD